MTADSELGNVGYTPPTNCRRRPWTRCLASLVHADITVTTEAIPGTLLLLLFVTFLVRGRAPLQSYPIRRVIMAFLKAAACWVVFLSWFVVGLPFTPDPRTG